MADQTVLRGPCSAAFDLRLRWLSLKAAEPGLRPRDGAARLGVTEAELVAARCGDGVQRLGGPWSEVVRKLPGLGTVMALTRNESVVHEKVGCFGNISLSENMGLVLNEDIDLRIFFDHWHAGFAVTEETRSGTRRSLQFFDADGTAVHKVYLRDESDANAYERLIRQHRHADQSPDQAVRARLEAPAERPDAEIDRQELRRRWRALRDPHDFHSLLQEVGVARVQALRLAGGESARRVGDDSFRVALEKAAACSLPIMVFAGSPGVIQIHSGPVCRLRRTGPWYNVLDPRFSLHLREDRIASAWVVRKPSADGTVTSLEIYDAGGRQIAWLFGERKPGQPERPGWRALANSLRGEGEASFGEETESSVSSSG